MASLSRCRPQAAIGRASTSRHCGRMKLRAIVLYDTALCNVQAAGCILPALTACPVPSVCQRPCPLAYLDGVDRPSTDRSQHHRQNLSADQEAGPEARGFQQPMPKKADEASDETLLTPRPPLRTGKLAWSHWSSVRDTLQILHSTDRCKSSKLRKRSWPLFFCAQGTQFPRAVNIEFIYLFI